MRHIDLHLPPVLDRASDRSDHHLHGLDGALDDPAALRTAHWAVHQKWSHDVIKLVKVVSLTDPTTTLTDSNRTSRSHDILVEQIQLFHQCPRNHCAKTLAPFLFLSRSTTPTSFFHFVTHERVIQVYPRPPLECPCSKNNSRTNGHLSFLG